MLELYSISQDLPTPCVIVPLSPLIKRTPHLQRDNYVTAYVPLPQAHSSTLRNGYSGSDVTSLLVRVHCKVLQTPLAA